MTNIVHFHVDMPDHDMPASDGVQPIYDEDGRRLLGGFIIERGDRARGFLSATDDPYRLFFSTSAPFYFTVYCGADGKVNSARVSDIRLNPTSIKITIYRIEECGLVHGN